MSGHETSTDIRREIAEVKALHTKLKKISAKNAKLLNVIVNKEGQLEAISEAVEKNANLLREFCSNLEDENNSLKQELNARRELMRRIESYEESHKARARYDQIVQEAFSTDSQLRRPVSQVVAQLSVTFDYFQGCDSNAEFLRRCRTLKADLDRRARPWGENVSYECGNLKRELAKVSQDNSRTTTESSAQKRVLEAELAQLRQRVKVLMART